MVKKKEDEWLQRSFDHNGTVSFGNIFVEFSPTQIDQETSQERGMNEEEVIECYKNIMKQPRREIWLRLKKLVDNGIPIYDLYEEDPRTPGLEGKYFKRTELSIAEARAMFLGDTTDPM